jgi:hypothetical protein
VAETGRHQHSMTLDGEMVANGDSGGVRQVCLREGKVSHLWSDVITASKRCSPEEGEGGDRNQKFGGFGGEFRRGYGHRATTEGEGCLWRVLLGRSGRAREKCSMWHR